MKWTQEDDEIIKQNCSVLTREQIQKLLPRRTNDAIKQRIIYLGHITKPRWTFDDDDIIRNNYAQLTALEIKNQFLPHRTKVGIKLRAQQLNCRKKASPNACMYSKNEIFWEIPNITNSYWAGMMAADGSLGIYNGSYRFVIQLSQKDEQHLEIFKSALSYTGPLSYSVKNGYRIKEKNGTVRASDKKLFFVKLDIAHCKKWHEDLIKNFNLYYRKTERLGPPNLDDYLVLAWLVGYIDGDGCICPAHDSKTGQDILRLQFTSSSEFILIYIQKLLDRLFPYNLRTRNITETTSSHIAKNYTIGGLKAAIIFDNLSKLDVPKLDRKWKRPETLALVEQYKQKHPEYFSKS